MTLDTDKLFLEYAAIKKLTINPNDGNIYAQNKRVGSSNKRSITINYRMNKHSYGIAQARAVWLLTYGLIEAGYHPSHKSENKFDDRLTNLELTTNAERGKRQAKMPNFKLPPNTGKLTLEQVNWARREALNPTVSYQSIANQLGVSKPTIIFACQGKTHKNATAPLVLKKPVRKRLIQPRKKPC